MHTSFYTIIYSLALYLIFLSNFVRIKDKYIIIGVVFLFLSSAFRIDDLNGDTQNYLYYFETVGDFDSYWDLLTDLNWIKIEPGFKALLYVASPFNLTGTSVIFMLLIMAVHVSVFLIIYKNYEQLNGNGFSIFIFFYICFFIFVFHLAIIRFSVAACFLMWGYHCLVYEQAQRKKAFILLAAASMFHLSSLIFVMALIYFYFANRFKYRIFLLVIPFVSVLFLGALLQLYSGLLGLYYAGLLENTETKLSIRLLAEGFITIAILYSQRNNEKTFPIFTLTLVLYLFFSFVEIYFGIAVLNRFRILAWMLFLYSFSHIWHQTNAYLKILTVLYGLYFYANQISNIKDSWL